MYQYIGIVHNSAHVKNEEELKLNKHLINITSEPDEEVYFDDEDVSFHYKYMSDKQNKSNQVNYEDDKFWLIFIGQIYNIDMLQQELLADGYKLQEDSDAEVLAVMFSKYKEKTFQHLRGMFSLIIWDKESRTLYGARDHFGIKALFYNETDDGLVFASDKKSLVSMLESDELTENALQHYLSFQYVPEPFTMTAGIKKVEPGHYFVKKPGEALELKQFWNATFHPVLMEKQDWIKRIREVLYDSVSVHMRGDAPIGSFLSGGIDSTIIVAMAKEHIPDLKTFSVGFEREGFSEIDVARKTADALDVENISYVVSPEEYIEALPSIMWHLDDPLADPSCIPLYFCGKIAKEHVGTVLSGEGSDELFGGYNIYREPESLKIFNSMPSVMKSLLAKVAHTLPESVRGKSFLERGTTPLRERYIGNAKIFEENEKKQILKSFDDQVSYQQITGRFFDYVKDYPLVNQMQYVDIHTWMRGNIALKADRMSIANSIELRVPFLDKEVFRVANEIPVDLKIANGTTKNILREAARGIIPDHVLDRKKLGFPVPIRHWLKNELNGWAKQLIAESQTDHLLHKSYILDLLEAHCQGKDDYSRKIWTVLMFMLWHQVFIEDKYGFLSTSSSNKEATSNLVPIG